MPQFDGIASGCARQARLPENREDSPSPLPPPACPETSYAAYVAGVRACRAGTDLAALIHEAVLRWPLHEHQRWCELVASASLGYWTEGGRR